MKGPVKTELKIGILAVQGDYEAHSKVLQRLGVEWRLVFTPGDMDGLSGLILPGGESSTMMKFLDEEGLGERIKQLVADGGAVFGTCAGVILLASHVQNPEQRSLGLADLTVTRNAYGRQLASHVGNVQSKLKKEPLEAVFIRAPIIEEAGKGVERLAEYQGRPVLVRQGRILAATFHPELTGDTTVHEAFLQLARNGS